MWLILIILWVCCTILAFLAFCFTQVENETKFDPTIPTSTTALHSNAAFNYINTLLSEGAALR